MENFIGFKYRGIYYGPDAMRRVALHELRAAGTTLLITASPMEPVFVWAALQNASFRPTERTTVMALGAGDFLEILLPDDVFCDGV